MNSQAESDFDGSNSNINKEEAGNRSSPSDCALVKSDSKVPLKTPVKDGDCDVQVKFSINDSSNGRGKCIMENALPSFSGLSKEELLKYANDPFWIRMRLLLFIMFWAVWVAMFIGAIAIIVLAPKCEAPKKPEWYEQGPLYELDIENFVNKESKNMMQSMKEKLNYLFDLKIKGVILSPIFSAETSKEENVIDFTSIDEKLGSLEDFKDFVKEANQKEVNVILSFVPNHSSNKHVWFKNSVAKLAPYDDYYVWAPASGVSADGKKLPPNNWLSLKGGSAWEWVEERQEFYLHQFDVDQPDLNYHNPNVVNEMKNIFSFWIENGVKGFNLDKVQYLLEDKGLQNESPGEAPGTIHTQYEFYSHAKTHNVPEVADLLSSWRQYIHEKSQDNGVLITTGHIPAPPDSNSSTIVVDISRNDNLLKHLNKEFSAASLKSHIEKIIGSSEKWPAVQLGDRHAKRVADFFGDKNVDGLNMLMLLLPATPITYFGEELGSSDATPFNWDNAEYGVAGQQKANESHYKVYEALVKARDTQTVLYGNSNIKILNDSVLVLSRINLGNPAYLVAYNPTSDNVSIDLSNLEYVPSHLMVYTKSVHSTLNLPHGVDKVKSQEVFLEANSAAVFMFAPKVEE